MATNDVRRPPAEGVYSYRQQGEFRSGGEHGRYPQSTQRRVDDVRSASDVGGIVSNAVDDAYTWNVTETASDARGRDVTTTTAFKLNPQRNIEITGITTRYADGSSSTFEPVAGNVTWIQFPAADRPVWSSRAVDPVHGITYELAARVSQESTVDACGELIDAWRVQILNSETEPSGVSQVTYLRDSSMNYVLGGHYDVATQFNGLDVAEDITMTAVDGSFSSRKIVTINSVRPAPAGGTS